MIALLLAVLSADTLLIDVQLAGVNHAVVEAVLTRDSTLLLPARDVAVLLGLPPPTSRWTTPAILRQQFPTVTIIVDLRQLSVWIEDPLRVFPATRRAWDAHRIQPRGTLALPIRSGPFLAFAGDERQHHVTDVGYAWRGKLAVQGRHASALGSSWVVSFAPSPLLFLSYGDGDRQRPTISGRVATGPVWIAPTWQQGKPLGVDGLVAWGPVKLFGSTRDQFALTITGRGGDLQVGRSAGRTSARVSWGPIPASPFSPPFVP